MELPLSLIAPARISKDTPNGILFPFKRKDPIVFAFAWDAKPYVLHLEGPNAFQYGEIKAGYVAKGALIHDIEFLIDMDSRYNAETEEDPEGALVLQGGQLFIMAGPLGNPLFDDPQPVPVMSGLSQWDAEAKVGFARWSIAARVGTELNTIWSKKPSKSA